MQLSVWKVCVSQMSTFLCHSKNWCMWHLFYGVRKFHLNSTKQNMKENGWYLKLATHDCTCIAFIIMPYLTKNFWISINKVEGSVCIFFREKKGINSKDVRWIAMKDRNTSMDIGIEPTWHDITLPCWWSIRQSAVKLFKIRIYNKNVTHAPCITIFRA